MCTWIARNCVGVSSRTAFVGSPTSRAGPRRRTASGRSRGSASISPVSPRSPPVKSAATDAAWGSNTRTAVSTACSTTASVWFPRRRANRCCDQPPAAVRPWTCRASTLETTRSEPSNTPTAPRPRRTSSTAARCGCRAAAVNVLSRAGPGVQSNGARRLTVVVSSQVTRTAPSARTTSVNETWRSGTPSTHCPRLSGVAPSRRPPPAAGRARVTGTGSGGGVRATDAADRQPFRGPGLEAAHHVGGAVETQRAQGVGHQAGAVALVAQHDHLDVVAGHLGDPPRAGRVQAPLQHVAVDDHRARYLAVPAALLPGPRVHQQGTGRQPGGRFDGVDAVDPPAHLRQQVVDRAGA